MPGSGTHQASKANNACEWFSVYPIVGETAHSAALRASCGQACDSPCRTGILACSLPASAWVTCGAGLESAQASTDHPGSGASHLRPGTVGLCPFPSTLYPGGPLNVSELIPDSFPGHLHV